MKRIKFLRNGEEITLKEVVKDFLISIRIVWRMYVSEVMMIRIHCKVLDYLMYHYDTKMMLLSNPNLGLLSEMYKNLDNLNNGAKHELSLQVLENTNRYLAEYFKVIREHEQSNNSK